MKNYEKTMTLKVSKAFTKKLKELNLIHEDAVITHISRQYICFPKLTHYITVESQYASGRRLPIEFIAAQGNRKIHIEYSLSEVRDYSQSTWRNELQEASEALRKLHINHKKND